MVKTQGEKTGSLDVIKALILQERRGLLIQILWSCLDSMRRLGSPFVLRAFLIWLGKYKNGEADIVEGCFWGAALVFVSFLFLLFYHRLFWTGFFTGFKMRTSLLTAIHAKLLRLNSSSVSRVTTGHIVSLASNDVNKMDLAVTFWPFLIVGPFESVGILLGVTYVLGIVPAIAGMSCLFILVPLQAFLSRYIAHCRDKTALITDRRVNLIAGMISGILSVKMLGWEDPLIKDVNSIRDEEHRLLRIRNLIEGGVTAVPQVTHAIMYRFMNGELNMPDVFFALALMAISRLSLTDFFLFAVQFMSEAVVTCKRMDAFLKLEEPLSSGSGDLTSERGKAEIHNGNFGWYGVKDDADAKKTQKSFKRLPSETKLDKLNRGKDSELRQTLFGIDLDIEPGELIGIAGLVGSGKSTILAAFLNDMETLAGNSRIVGRTSYSGQVPWIVAGTVRENITFGRPFDQELYEQVIFSCALDVDLEQFPSGDYTELGEHGINISGGQKARLALARAAYSKADVHLLDDPLSAVDPRVGRVLFDKCIGPSGLMHSQTRLLVTHQHQYLPLCDRIVLMNDGCIESIGKWEDLKDHPILHSMRHEQTNTHVDLDDVAEASATAINPDMRDLSQDKIHNKDQLSRANGDLNRERLVEDEKKEEGTIALSVYWQFMRHTGLLPFLLCSTVLIISIVLFFISEWWVAAWSSANDEEKDDMNWVWILIGLNGVNIITHVTGILGLYLLLLIGSTRLHSQMTHCVMHAPLKFFHVNPTGRILNRFTKDMNIQDEILPLESVEMWRNLFMVVGTFVLVGFALPYVLIFFVFISCIFWRLRQIFTKTTREIKRFDGITRSPVYAMLSANIKGLATIRAFDNTKAFQERFMEAVDVNSSWWTAYITSANWIGVRMDAVTTSVMAIAVILSLLVAKDVSSTLLGLALTYVHVLSGLMQWTFRQTAEFENAMTSVERNMEYTQLEQEPQRAADGGGIAPEGWPEKGEIEYRSLTASYRPGLEPVLKNLSFTIPGGSCVGIVGRTGSGKSSLLLTLFRMIDVNSGEIRIDGIDTSSLGIDVLRRQLAIIPQDPVLFGGTIRSNLDPWNEHSDSRIWKALRQVCLDSAVADVGGLEAKIAESGNNLSVGQRQLLCLARALLANAKILALDEATANVDRATDAMIQQSLRPVIEKNDKTLLIIAHRINTVLNCDLLLVLERGELVEFGSPQELMVRDDGFFSQMVFAARNSSTVNSDCS